MTDAQRLGNVVVPQGWRCPATPCDLVPKWEGEFATYDDWVNFADHRLSVPVSAPRAICVDALGRRCHVGWQFHRARDENAFPVRYFFECEVPHG